MSPDHPLLRGGLFVTFYLGCLFVSDTLVGQLLSPMHLAAQDFLLAATALGGLLAVTLATGLMLAFHEKRSFGFVGLSLDHAWYQPWLLGFLFGCSLAGAAVAIVAAFGQARIRLNENFQASRLAYVVVILLLAAAGEEMLFRGYGFQRLLDAGGPAFGVVLGSVLFGSLHGSNPSVTPLGVLNTMLVGVLLAVAYLRTRRLWLPIGLHWGWNLAEAALGFPVSGITIQGMPLVADAVGLPWISGGAYGPEASVFGTLVILAGTAGLLLVKKPPAGSSHA